MNSKSNRCGFGKAFDFFFSYFEEEWREGMWWEISYFMAPWWESHLIETPIMFSLKLKDNEELEPHIPQHNMGSWSFILIGFWPREMNLASSKLPALLNYSQHIDDCSLPWRLSIGEALLGDPKLHGGPQYTRMIIPALTWVFFLSEKELYLFTKLWFHLWLWG